MLRTTTIAGLAAALALSIASGQDTPPDPEPVSYRWSTSISIPLSPSGFSEFFTGSLAGQLTRPMIFQRPGFSQHLRIGVWATTYLPKSGSDLYGKYQRYTYGIGYVMLDFQQILSESQGAERVSLVGGLGAGISGFGWNAPYAATGQRGDSGRGRGYMINGGLRLELGRLVTDMRANFNNGQPSPVITADIGYRSKSMIGAAALPIGAVTVLLVIVYLLVQGGAFSPIGF